MEAARCGPSHAIARLPCLAGKGQPFANNMCCSKKRNATMVSFFLLSLLEGVGSDSQTCSTTLGMNCAWLKRYDVIRLVDYTPCTPTTPTPAPLVLVQSCKDATHVESRGPAPCGSCRGNRKSAQYSQEKGKGLGTARVRCTQNATHCARDHYPGWWSPAHPCPLAAKARYGYAATHTVALRLPGSPAPHQGSWMKAIDALAQPATLERTGWLISISFMAEVRGFDDVARLLDTCQACIESETGVFAALDCVGKLHSQ